MIGREYKYFTSLTARGHGLGSRTLSMIKFRLSLEIDANALIQLIVLVLRLLGY